MLFFFLEEPLDSRYILIQVWENDAKILNFLGEDDLAAPIESIHFAKDCFPAANRDNFEIVSYPKAGHLIEPPYSPLCRKAYNKAMGKLSRTPQ